MRYTTLIDISENAAVYRNPNTRLLYLHLALKSGYHDADRDIINTSIRRLAMETGLTISAVRHALHVLEEAALLNRKNPNGWMVKKWIIQTPPTPRTQKNTARHDSDQANIGKRYEDEIQAYRERVMNAVRASTREELQQWLRELEEGRRLNHHGASIAPNQDNVRWMKSIIEKL